MTQPQPKRRHDCRSRWGVIRDLDNLLTDVEHIAAKGWPTRGETAATRTPNNWREPRTATTALRHLRHTTTELRRIHGLPIRQTGDLDWKTELARCGALTLYDPAIADEIRRNLDNLFHKTLRFIDRPPTEDTTVEWDDGRVVQA